MAVWVRLPLSLAAIRKWAEAQGFKNLVPANKMHVTVAFSRTTLDWMRIDRSYEAEIRLIGGARLVELLGPKNAPVLMFKSESLEARHRNIMLTGASWDFDGYYPHISLSYDSTDVNLDKIENYQGEIVLGEEVFEEVVENWATMFDARPSK